MQHGHDADTRPSIDSDKQDTSIGDVEKGAGDLGKAPAATETAVDPTIVDWDGPDDPANPQNWSSAKKWSNIAVLSALTLLVPLGSSFFAPAIPEVLREFDVNNEALATWVLSVSVYHRPALEHMLTLLCTDMCLVSPLDHSSSRRHQRCMAVCRSTMSAISAIFASQWDRRSHLI